MRLARRTRTTNVSALTAVAVLAVAPLVLSGSSATAASAPVAPLLGADAARTIAASYVVVLEDTAAAGRTESISAVATAAGGQVHHTYGAALRGFAAPTPTTASADTGSDALKTKVPWNLDRIDQRNLPLDKKFVYTTTGAGVTAYVLDSGVRATHTDVGGRVQPGFTAIEDGKGTDDCFGSGTEEASILGGVKYGVAKDVDLVPVRVLDCKGSGTISQVIAGVDWVTANAVKPAVASVGFGGDTTKSMDDAIRGSIASGVQYAIASGESFDDACYYSPSRIQEAVIVGATDSLDWADTYSSWGDCLDLWAPGLWISAASNKNDTATSIADGTYAAAPHVAGVMARYLEETPDLTPQELQDKLVSKSSKGKLLLVFGPNRLLYAH